MYLSNVSKEKYLVNYLENMTELDSSLDCYSPESVNMQTERNPIYEMLEILIPHLYYFPYSRYLKPLFKG